MDEDTIGVVIDHGSFKCKAGFSGDDSPRAVFPSVVGRPKSQGTIPSVVGDKGFCVGDKGFCVGDVAMAHEDVLNINHPIKHGLIDWDHMEDREKIWQHMFEHELRVDPKLHPLMVLESPLCPKHNKELMANVIFEKFGVPGFYIANQAVMAMYASGELTGTVVDSGHVRTYSVPIHEGHAVSVCTQKSEISGSEVTNRLGELLRRRGYTFSTPAELVTLGDIKARFGYLARDYEKELESYTESEALFKSYELPDGSSITIGQERIQCTEALFQPSLAGSDSEGIHRIINNSITTAHEDIRKHLYNKVIMSGASTMFPGLSDRLMKELLLLAPNTMRIKIIAPPERKCSVWIGGSIVSSLSTSMQMWIQKSEYDEYGPVVIHRKCSGTL